MLEVFEGWSIVNWRLSGRNLPLYSIEGNLLLVNDWSTRVFFIEFKPDKAFAGTSEKSGPIDTPVEFEKEVEEADPFYLDQFLTEVKKGKKAMDKVGWL
ncbi:hypothetical protein GOBAR_DD30725 [Gossypium barbadense]|nr:hypothetical protein GOBAR_DD30725 [Gossypium barbadense]